MARGIQVSGIVWLFVAMAAVCACGRSARAAMAARADSSAVTPPAAGPGANFDRQAYVEGLREVPGILARVGVACTVRQAVYEGLASFVDTHGKPAARGPLYEVACAEGLGYLLNVRGKEAPLAVDCIAGGATGEFACMLPLNNHPAGGLEPSLKAAGVQ